MRLQFLIKERGIPRRFPDIPLDLEPLRIRAFQGDPEARKALSNNEAAEANETKLRAKDSGAKEKRRIKVRMFGNDLIIPNGVKYLKDVPAFLVKLGEKTKEIRIQALNMQIRKLQAWKKKLLISLGRNETDYDKAEAGEQGMSSFSPSVTNPSPTDSNPTDSSPTKEMKSFPSSAKGFDDHEMATLSSDVSHTEHVVDLEEIFTNLPESTPIYRSSRADFSHRSWRKVARRNRPNFTSLRKTVEPRMSQVVPDSDFHIESDMTEGYEINLLDEDPEVGEQTHEPRAFFLPK
ncbi:hypothetical protein TCAL_05105 [Tigriopus californicus]|uniref:Uncharacterized protein n=2 Tax=Tigriopus californicus TaxID=6832 RepID=A0A553NVR0_TIGCA|nr:hypothetical protein TCAL_05105 [Tigriopus californicus]